MKIKSSSESDHQMINQTPHGAIGQAFRPVRMGRYGTVVANHPLAAQAGLQTLMKGGNAVDAAVTVGFALGAAEPQGSSIGGDGFIMVHMRNELLLEVVNGTGAAPQSASAEQYPDGIPYSGVKSSSVPGIVDALLSAHEKHGKLKLETCIEPAIELCEEGVPVSHFQAISAAKHSTLMSAPTSKAVFAPDGNPLKPGDIRRNPNLGSSYRLIAKQGRDAFYRGEIALEIERFCFENGGFLTAEDFKQHKVRWQVPITTNYGGRSVYEAPPNSSGHVLLQELNLLECIKPKSFNYLSAEAIHLMVEAKKLAFADRERYLGDPEYIDIPIEGLISKEYAAERAKLIDPNSTLKNVRYGDPWAFQEKPVNFKKQNKVQISGSRSGAETTHFCIVDQWGNAVSELQSIQTMFGSGVIAGKTGILLNNRMTYWHLKPDHTNYLRPGRRVRHTMNPVMVFSNPIEKGGQLELVLGTPGGDTQVQTNFQIITGVFDHNLTVAEAVEGPRWTHYQGDTDSTYPHATRTELVIEDRISPKTASELEGKGQPVKIIGPFEGAGSAGAIMVQRNSGVMMAASDPRRDGYTALW